MNNPTNDKPVTTTAASALDIRPTDQVLIERGSDGQVTAVIRIRPNWPQAITNYIQ